MKDIENDLENKEDAAEEMAATVVYELKNSLGIAILNAETIFDGLDEKSKPFGARLLEQLENIKDTISNPMERALSLNKESKTNLSEFIQKNN